MIPLYAVPNVVAFSEVSFLVSAVIIVGVSVLVLVRKKKWPRVLWFYYLVVLAPMSGIFQSGSQIAADRYTYLSMMSWPLGVAGAFLYLGKRASRSILTALSVGLLALLSVLTWRQVRRWHDAETLWRYVLIRDPDNAFADYNLGGYYQDQNRPADAARYLKASLALEPDPAVYYKLGTLAEREGRRDAAADFYRRAIALKPSHGEAINGLANVLTTEGKNKRSDRRSSRGRSACAEKCDAP